MDKSNTVDYTAALRQFRQYGRGRSMKQFCEEEGYDYRKFCRFSRCGAREQDIQSSKLEGHKSDTASGGFIPLEVEDKETGSAVSRPISQIRVRFSTGMEITLQGSTKEEMLNVIKGL